ncbi:hypothetical protein L1887_01202 [Cichorium endivia]|nr:hypothetical protein L1887_01202 [Cichorium endivia]
MEAKTESKKKGRMSLSVNPSQSIASLIRAEKSKKLLEQSLCQIQNMVCYEYERRDGNQACPQCKTRYKRHKGSPRVDGDDDEDDVDDLENEFDYAQGNAKGRRQWQGEDPDLSSSSRRESQQPVPLLTNDQQVSGEIPSATPDNLSIRSTSGPLGPGDKNGHYMDPRQPVPVRIVDPSKDLNSYGLGNVDWKERVEGWKLKQDKNIMQMANRYSGEGRGGEIEGTGSNGEELQLVDDPRQSMSRVLRRVKLSLDPYEKEAGKAVKLLLKGYGTGNSSENESENDLIRIAALKLRITSQKALKIEKISIKKLLNQLSEGDGRLQKKHILIILLDALKKYGNAVTFGLVENDDTLQNQDYKYFGKTTE